ncbi:MAG TPA: agmatine deiminase family protein [Candidatus Binatus sp.]|nr:agmatine deiminase family protein [Candidatus Binatus sp.]
MAKALRKPSSKTLNSASPLPAALGYRMPAEWEPHAATWLAWPHYHDDWPGKFEPIPWVYAEIIRNLAKHERVELIVNNATAARQARKVLERAEALSANIRFHRWPTNRVWLRDSGCIFLAPQPGFARPDSRGRLSPHEDREGHEFTRADKARKRNGASAPQGGPFALKFRFNAWAKYSNWRFDEKIGSLMANVKSPTLAAKNAARIGHPLREIHPVSGGKRIVLEGGSIDVNGLGTIITTEECLLSKVQERNPHMARVHYEKAFTDYLGAPHTIWLGRGIFGDDTHGHVDDLTRFVSRDTVVTMVEPDSKDINHGPLRANLRRLQASRDQNGKQLTVVELPMPQPVVFEGRRLPASYANFYIANGVVLAPVFNRPNDRIALNTLAQLFPSREIVPIYSGDFIWGLGAMHCMTQQQPE